MRACSKATSVHESGLGVIVFITLLAVLVSAVPSRAAVFDTTIADVTTRAFSTVWFSDEPVTDATVRVFSDVDGTTEITGGLTITPISASFPLAHDQGLVKVEVTGLQGATCVYVQTLTATASGTVLFPDAPPFLEVCTAVATRKANDAGLPITNDLIIHDVLTPGDASPATGALIVVDVPGVGAHPLTAFVGQGFAAPGAVVDLNNLFDAGTGLSAEVSEGLVMTIKEFRGLLCPGGVDHTLLHIRRVPAHEEIATIGIPITELESAALCFFADTADCDGTVSIADAQRVLNILFAVSDECVFNPDLDIVADGEISIADVQGVLNRLFESAPFTP